MSQKNKTENPYLAARQEWLERYGSYIKSRANWRLTAFVSLGILAASVVGNVVQATQSKVVPYVVQVDRLGKALAVGRADRADAIPERIIQAEIANVIVNWRSVTADIGLQQKMVRSLSAHLTGAAKGMVKSWYETNSPYERAQKVLVDVVIKGIPLPVSQDSWRIEWRETVRNHSGVAIGTTAYEATLAVRIVPPKTDAQIMKNPAGVYVTSISAAKLLGQS